MLNVLVTDGNQRAALAVTRSLGAKGVKVITADVELRTLSSASRYAYRSEVYSSQSDLSAFLASIKAITQENNIGVIFPITEITLFILLQHKEQFPNIVIPFDSYKKVSLLSDKAKLVDLCVLKGFPCPKSQYVENGAAALSGPFDFNYPVVLKPYKSRIYSEGQWISTSVTYATSTEQLRQICTESPVFSRHPFIIQEFIEGHGQGVFLLFDHGRVIARFCHKRLREKPPSGGVSVLSESIEQPEDMTAIAIGLLEEVNWHGVAMVEFKVNEKNGPFVMEVNTRFWGSLQLAIDSGVDFPYLLYRIASGEQVEPDFSYKIGRRLRWLLGDFDRLYLVLKSQSYTAKIKFKAILVFLGFFGKGLRYEINRFNDFRPFIEELRQYFANIFHKG